MNYLRHPYLLSIVGVITLLVVGTVIVDVHLPVTAADHTSGWGASIDANSYTSPSYAPAAQYAPPPAPTGEESPAIVPGAQDPSSFIYDPSPTANSAAETIIDTDTSFDFNSFMQRLSGSAPRAPKTSAVIQTSADVDPQDAYAFVPVQLFSTETNAAPARSDIQQALYAYGNTAGSSIKTYELLHPNASAIVQRFFDDRKSAASGVALKRLADDIKGVGTDLKKAGGVPAPAAVAHGALADSYIDLGEKLVAIPSAQTDDALLKKIDIYENAVQLYAKNYTALVLLFSKNGVSFRSDEPGSVFMFSPL